MRVPMSHDSTMCCTRPGAPTHSKITAGVVTPRVGRDLRHTSKGERSAGFTRMWAPNVSRSSRRSACSRTTMIGSMPRAARAATAESPIAPAPITIGISPGASRELRT